jgi:hypothetical protein
MKGRTLDGFDYYPQEFVAINGVGHHTDVLCPGHQIALSSFHASQTRDSDF